jgi:hypothetical protein
VAERDLALQSEGDGPVGHQAELPGAERAVVVQVDVDAGAVPGGQVEQRVELAHRVAVHAGGVDPAERGGATAERLVQQLQRARPAEDAVLGEGDLLDIDETLDGLGRLAHGVEPVQADPGVHVGVGADPCGAEGSHVPQQGRGVLGAGQGELLTPGTLVRDPVHEPGAGRVRHPLGAPQGLVHVAVGVDQAGEGEPAAAVLDADVDSGCLDPGPGLPDVAVLDQDVHGPVGCVGQAHLAEEKVAHGVDSLGVSGRRSMVDQGVTWDTDSSRRPAR